MYKFENILFKITPATILILGMLTFNIFPTNAYFNDTENSADNTFSAGILSVNISGRNISGTMLPGEATTTTITLSKSNPTNLDFQYIASSTIVGDATACNFITISASSSPQNYSLSLKEFVSATSTPTGPAQWDFIFTVGNGAPVGTCNFKIIYTAWQTDLPDSSGGFSDVAEMIGSIEIGQVVPTAPTVPDVVLNEFLPNPEGDDTAPMPNGEWVELYNNTNSPINLSGYYLTDADSSHKINVENCRTNTGNTIISGKGFLVVYRYVNSSCNSHNFDLNNTGGDTVNLYSPGGVLLDARPYDNSNTDGDSISDNTPGTENQFTGAENPAQEGKSIARIPDGIGAWVDPIPTPGEPNKMEEISEGDSGGAVPDIVPADVLPVVTEPEIVEIEPISETSILVEPAPEPIIPTEENI